MKFKTGAIYLKMSFDFNILDMVLSAQTASIFSGFGFPEELGSLFSNFASPIVGGRFKKVPKLYWTNNEFQNETRLDEEIYQFLQVFIYTILLETAMFSLNFDAVIF